MRITNIHLENFCGLKALDADIYPRTLISGVNESGKSTIRRAIFWCFNVRDENGKEITGIRPHDENGVDNLEAETVAEITLDNGITLRKAFRAMFSKHGDFKGNATDCYVSGIPKKATEYEEFVRQIMPADECINAQAFFSLDTNGRRKMLETAFGQLSTDELIGRFPEYEGLREPLKVGTIAELKKAWNYELNGDKRHKGLKDSLDDIPTRIDEVERQGGGVELSELSLAVSGLEKDISELDKQEAELDEVTKTYDAAAQGILELKFEQGEIVRKANEGIVKARNEAETAISNLQGEKKKAQRNKHSAEWDLDKANWNLTDARGRLKKAQDGYRATLSKTFDESPLEAIKAEEFGENALICPTCKQELPKEQQETLKSDWEKSKAERIAAQEDKREVWENAHTELLKEITEDGDKAQSDKKKAELDKADAEKRLAEAENQIADISKMIAAKESELDELPTEADLSQNAEYQRITAQIAEKKAAMENMSSGAEKRAEIKRDRAQKQEELNRCQSQILAQRKTEADKERRIEELHKEQKELAQRVADVEKRIDLLKNFERQKNELFEQSVNRNFQYINVRLFEQQVNGDLRDTCKVTLNGTDYNGTLNHGGKILAEIDICHSFQLAYGMEEGIVIVDDSESLDSDRIPQLEGVQMIILRRTDEDRLTIKEM